jgi:metal-responsive CopG/Arc/MetJ family transcriptional regulator
MKTAISIPDALFERAEVVAREMAISRSELYAKAVEAYIKGRLGAEVTNRLNTIYSREESRLDPALARMQASSIPAEQW